MNEAEGHIRPNKDFSLKEGTIHSRNTVLCPSGDYKEGEDREEEADNNQEVHTLPQDYSNGALL